MRKDWLLVFALALCSFTFFKISPSKNITGGDIKADINGLLPRGKVNAAIMDGFIQTPRQVELTSLFQQGVQKNKEWFLNYVKAIPPGEPMPYNEKFGISEAEYKELLGYLNNIRLASSGNGLLTIKNKGDIIEFKGKGKLSIFESVKVNLQNNSVQIGKYNLINLDTINVTDEKNALGSKWTGYEWKLEEPENMDSISGDLSNVFVKQYSFKLGQLENDKTMMEIKGMEVTNGIKTVQFEIPLLF